MGSLFNMIREMLQNREKARRLRRAVTVLAAVAVFVTTYALILPAVTIDRNSASGEPGFVLESLERTGKKKSGKKAKKKAETEESKSKKELKEESKKAAKESKKAEEASRKAEESKKAEKESKKAAKESKKAEEASRKAEESKKAEEESRKAEKESKKAAKESKKAEEASKKAEKAAKENEKSADEGGFKAEAGKAVFEGEDYKVTVKFEKKAGLPKDVTLNVKEIRNSKKQKDTYADYQKKALKALKVADDEELVEARFFELEFSYDGEELDPEAAVTVVFEWDNKLDLDKNEHAEAVFYNAKKKADSLKGGAKKITAEKKDVSALGLITLRTKEETKAPETEEEKTEAEQTTAEETEAAEKTTEEAGETEEDEKKAAEETTTVEDGAGEAEEVTTEEATADQDEEVPEDTTAEETFAEDAASGETTAEEPGEGLEEETTVSEDGEDAVSEETTEEELSGDIAEEETTAFEDEETVTEEETIGEGTEEIFEEETSEAGEDETLAEETTTAEDEETEETTVEEDEETSEAEETVETEETSEEESTAIEESTEGEEESSEIEETTEEESTEAEETTAEETSEAEETTVEETTEEETTAVEESTEEETTVEETETEETSEEETSEEAEEIEKGILVFEGRDYSVTVRFEEEAGIPDDAELSVRELPEDSGEYKSYRQDAQDLVEGIVTYARLFDIAVKSGDGIVEPAADLNVTIALENAVQEERDLHVVHFAEGDLRELEAEVIEGSEEEDESAAARDEIHFVTSSLTVEGIVGTEEAEEWPAQSFEASTATMKVTVDAPEGAFPAGTTMDVVDVEDEETVDIITEAVENENVAVKAVTAVDITFYNAEEEEIEPLLPISVVMTKIEPAEDEQTSSLIVHVDEEGDVNVVEPDETPEEEASEAAVAFTAKSFSMYAYVEVIETFVITADGETYKISVSYGKEAGIPENAELVVDEILSTSDDYAEYIEKSEEVLGGNTGDAEYARFFDIRIVDENGEKVEIAAPVEVKIELSDKDNESNNPKIVHFTDDKDMGSVLDSMNDEDGSVSFETDGFSVFAVIILNQEEGTIVFEGEDYTIRVSYTKEAQIPMGTVLTVNEIEQDSDAFTERLGLAWKEVNREYFEIQEMHENYNEGMGLLPVVPLVNLDQVRFFDIALALDGEEIKPLAPVEVEIIYNNGIEVRGEVVAGVADYSDKSVELVENVETSSKDGSIVSFKYMQDNISGMGTFVGRNTYESYAKPVIAPAPVYETNTPGFDNLRGTTDDARDISLGEDDDEELPAPVASKILTPNKDENGHDDGTYSLTLSVKGATQVHSATDVTKSNVLIVMDRSSSMVDNYAQLTNVRESNDATPREGVVYYGREQHNSNYRYFPLTYTNGRWYCERYSYTQELTGTEEYTGRRYTGNIESRLTAEQTALSSLINELLSKNQPGTVVDGVDLSDIIEISVISFGDERFGTTPRHGTKATEIDWTTDYDDLMGGVSKNTTTSGTNWEDALQYAKEVADAKQAEEGQDDEQMFIIFLTDGEPTAYSGEYGGAHHYNSTGGGFIQAYEPARDDAKALVDAEYELYGIFTYGGGEEQLSYLKRLINYSYGKGDVATDTEELQKYFYDAANTNALLSAFQNIISSITNAVGYGRVSITDGLTSDAMTTTVVSGKADGFVYKVTGPVGDLYTVTATGGEDGSDPTVTFQVGGNNYTGVPKTDEDGKVYYSVTIGSGDSAVEYKMALVKLDADHKITWDLSAIGVLMDGYTYSVSFIVWPNQEAYDYVAGLNNDIAGYTWDDSIEKDSGKGYYTGGVPDHPSIVKYKGNPDVYSVLTNTDQKLTYSIVTTDTVIVNGEETTVTNYSDPIEIDLPAPDPMPLEGSDILLRKRWEDNLQDHHTGVYDSVTLDLLVDNKLYIDDIVLTSADNWREQHFAIAPGIMVSEGEEAYSYATKFLVYNGKNYGILEPGHDYCFKEDKLNQNSYDDQTYYILTAYTYHPMLIDGVLWNVSFTYNDSNEITAVNLINEMTEIGATNTLKGGINIIKELVEKVDGEDVIVHSDETFKAKVTLTAPMKNGAPDFSQVEKYECDEYSTNQALDGKPVAWYKYYKGGVDSTTEATVEETAFAGDTNRDSGKWFYLLFDESTGIAEGTICIKDGYVARFVNMATGIEYSVVETQTNDMIPSYEYTHRYKSTETSEWVVKTDTGAHYVYGNQQNNVKVINRTVTANIQILKKNTVNEEPLDGVKFRLYTTYDASDPSKNVEAVTAEGNPVGEITTSNGGKASIGNIVTGTYYLVETEPLDGYLPLSEPVEITVYMDEDNQPQVVYMQALNSSGEPITVVAEDGSYQLIVYNSSGVILPSTGGPGSRFFTFFGSILMAFAGVGVILMRKKRRSAV